MGTVNTVLGPIATEDLGYVQPHEHLIANLLPYVSGGEHARTAEITLANQYESRIDRNNRADWVLDDVDTAVTELELFRSAGGGTLVEVSSLGMGRNPLALREISQRTGVHVVMGCGYYVADWHPEEVAGMSRDAITERIVEDVIRGADGTDVRAGIIGEIGMSWPHHPDEVKVLEAAAQAQNDTGATLMIHTGRHEDAPAAHLRCALDAGADPTRTILCHIDRTIFDLDRMLALADTGCVLEYDLFGTESGYYPLNPAVDMPNDAVRVRYIDLLVARGYGDQILVSSDVCRKTMLSSYGGEGYAHILRRTLALMRSRAISEAQIDQITRVTPARLLTLEQ